MLPELIYWGEIRLGLKYTNAFIVYVLLHQNEHPLKVELIKKDLHGKWPFSLHHLVCFSLNFYDRN